MNENGTQPSDVLDTTLTPSGLGQYISYSGCPRYFRLKYFDQEVVNERNWYNPSSQSELFAELGLAYEEQQLETLAADAEKLIGDEETDGESVTFDETWPASVETPTGETREDIESRWELAIRDQICRIIEDVATQEPEDVEGPIVLFQTPMFGQIGVWNIAGLADLITLEPLPETNSVRSRVLEVKTSWKEKTSHQIQSTIYSLLLDNLISELNIEHDPIASVINREIDLQEQPLSDLSTIDRASRRAEIKRLLKADGELHQLAQQSFEEAGYRLNRKCDGCPYNGICFTKAIEQQDPALLSITQGNQEQFRAHGIETLAEITELFEREDGTRPFDYDELQVREEETVRALESEGTLADRLDELAQRAQVLRGEIDPTYEPFDGVEYLRGSGNGILPDDDPNPHLPDQACERNELIRIYLYVQHDNVRDRLALLAGRVDSDKASSKEVVQFSSELPVNREESLEAERVLLEEFFEELFEAVQAVATEIGRNPDQGYVHLYTYSGQERDALMEAVQRQPSVFGSSAVRDLLGLREGIDQPMVSVVHSDITNRLALRYPGTGLLQTVEQMEAYAGGYYDKRWFSRDDWVVHLDGEEIDLQSVFKTGLFEGDRPFVEQGDSVRLLLGDNTDPDAEPDGYYPLYNRFGNQIPLEYLWAARGKLSSLADGSEKANFHAFRYQDGPGSEPITPEMVEALALKLTEALEHVERAIEYKNWQIDKQPIDVRQLPTFTLSDADLSQACREYLDLEHSTAQQECLEHYLKPPRKRVQSGDSTLFRVTNVEDGGQWDIEVEGELLYDELFRDPDHVMDSCRITGTEDGGSGSWRVMSKLESDGDEFRHVNATYPRYIANSMKATVTELDRSEGTISVEASTYGGLGDERYIEWHRNATMDPDKAANSDYTTLVSEGNLFILDPYADSYPSARAYAALERTDSNALYDQLNRAFQDGDADHFSRQFCSSAAIDEFLDAFEEATGTSPRGRQQDFVREVDHSVAVLQGPPGTGKTSFTLAPAVLARLFAAERNDRCLLTVVTAPSHTAINEAMEDIVDNWQSFTEGGGEMASTKFIRVGGRNNGDNTEENGENTDDPIETHVDFVDYYNTADVYRMTGYLRPHIDSSADDPSSHVLVFTTPTSLRGVIDECAGDLFGLDGAEEVMDAGISFVDFLVIDEASMLDLPSTLLASSFLREDSQTLLIGDHRQMEPVQQHDWEGEDRRTIEENVPFMSVLNFVRYLRGDLEETAFAAARSPDIGDAIPITRLDRTYRLHKRVAELLTALVYTDDGIELQSSRMDTLDRVTPRTDGVAAAMNPNEPVTLLIHDEDESQDANRTEVAIIEALIDALDDLQSDETGIVTPHNAQKGRLNQKFSDVAMIDTVERFQGGERDVMVISATASDPDYVRSEAEFLLNPNRLNVAMSRMKKKLVIVASKSVFKVTPPDADEFDKTLIWKRLYEALGVTENSPATAVWEGQLRSFCPADVDTPSGKGDTKIEIYALRAAVDDS